MVKRTSRGPAKAEFLVRFQVEALWPNSKRQRDPAVNRGCAGSTPAGHPDASVARLAEHRPRKAESVGSSPTAGSDRSWGEVPPSPSGSPATRVSDCFRRSSGGESVALKTRRPLVRLQPPELVTVSTIP